MKKVLAIVWFALSALLMVVACVLFLSIIGIIPGLGFAAMAFICVVYGVASWHAQPLRGALGRVRTRLAS